MFRARLSLSLIAAIGAISTSQAATRMNLSYLQSCLDPKTNRQCAAGEGRALLYTNNPEALIRSDLADSGGTPFSIHTVNVNAGRYRSFASHIANSGIVGGNIGYALVFRNTGFANATLRVRAKSAVDSCNPNGNGGGEIFTQVFNNYDLAVENYTIGPGQNKFLPITGSFPNYTMATSSCPNMLVDFDTSGSTLQVLHIAYRDARNINTNFASYVPMNYITGPSVLPGLPPEDRFYKGVNQNNAAILRAATTISASSTVGSRIPVSYTAYNGATQFRDFGSQSVFDRTWWSNINPGGQNGLASTAMNSDVFSFTFTRTHQGNTTTRVFSPTTFDGTGRYHNLGNWGVVYQNEITVTNTSSASRTIEFVLSPVPNAAFFAATMDMNPASTSTPRWVTRKSNGEANIVYSSCRIPANATAVCRGAYVLGGPGSADLIQYVRISR